MKTKMMMSPKKQNRSWMKFSKPLEINLVKCSKTTIKYFYYLLRLYNKFQINRYSAAKGIGRLTNRLSKDYADQVVDQILTLFSPRETEMAWHGGCLALAELGNLTNTFRFLSIINIYFFQPVEDYYCRIVFLLCFQQQSRLCCLMSCVVTIPLEQPSEMLLGKISYIGFLNNHLVNLRLFLQLPLLGSSEGIRT